MQEREDQILDTLASKVRFLTLEQLARTWWKGRQPRAAQSKLAQLEDEGWLRKLAVVGHPELELEAPVFTWRVGGSPPDVGPLAYALRLRWTDDPVRHPVYLATRKTVDVYGGHVGHAKSQNVTHDLHMGRIYLQLLEERPNEARDWVTEDELEEESEWGEVVVDAVLRTPGEAARLAVEFVGRSYDKLRLERIHDHCERKRLAYELW